MRYVGLIILIVAATSVGIKKSLELKRHEQTLSELISFLSYAENEIGTRQVPLKSLFLCEQRTGIQPFIAAVSNGLDRLSSVHFSTIWCTAVSQKLSILSDNELNTIKQLGYSLGRYDTDMQLSEIDKAVTQLQVSLYAMRSTLKSNQKMYIGLSSGLGLLISIVLI